MKKFFLLTCVAFFALNGFSKVGDTFNVDGCSYQVMAESSNEGEVCVSANLACTDLQIPATVAYNGISYAVRSVAPDGFRNNTITSVSIPEGVTTIGKGAFQNCKSLTSVSLPSTLVAIDYFAFSGCSKLDNVNVPSNTTYVGRQAFAGCESLTTINIPAGVHMGENVFLNCSALNEVSLPQELQCIKEGTFEMCQQLNVTLPRQLKYIEKHAFSGCSDLTSLALPESLEELGDYAFAGCEKLTELSVPQNINIIPDGAFAYCSKMQNISLPNSVQTIGSGTFKHNASLTHITLPSALTSLGIGDEGGTFERCDAMTELTIPAYVEEIGNLASLPNCLKSIYVMGQKIPDGLANMSHVNGQGESVVIYVKQSVYNSLYPTGEWNGFTVDYRIPVEMFNAKGKAVKYKTLCRDFDVELRYVNDNLSDGVGRLSAYVVDDASGDLGMVFMDEILYIPSRLKANVDGYVGEDEYVGVVLKGTPGCTYYYQIGENDYSQGEAQWLLSDAQSASRSKAPHVGTNMMKGVADATFISTQSYNEETGQTMTNYGVNNNAFRKISGPGWIGYNKSYLPLPENVAKANMAMTFTDVDGSTSTISITEFLADSDDAESYGLSGLKVNDSYRGIVIKNGKKIIRK